MRAVTVGLLVMWCSVAQAQPAALAEPKDKGVAYLLTGVGIGAPVVVVALISGGSSDSVARGVLIAGATAIFTPSAGHWYTGRFLTPGMGMRLLGGGVATLSVFYIVASDGDAGGEIIETVATLGLIGLGIGALHDLVTVGSAVEDWNRTHASVTPTVMQVRDGYGIGLAGSF